VQSPQVVEIRTPFGKEQAEPSDAISTLLPRAWLDADLTDLIQEQAQSSVAEGAATLSESAEAFLDALAKTLALHVADLRRIFKLYAKGSGARASCAGLGKLQFSRMCRECGLVLGVPRRNGAAAAREARLSPENLVASSEELTASSEELTASSEELALARIGASARAARASSEKLETSSPELATTAPELATSPQEPAKLTQSEVDSLFSRCNDDQNPYDLPSIRAAEYADQQREAKIRAKIQAELPTLADNVYTRLLEEYAFGSAVSARWSLLDSIGDKATEPAEAEPKEESCKEPVRQDYTNPDWEGPLEAEIECDQERVARIERRRAALAERQYAEGTRDSPVPRRLKKRPAKTGMYDFAASDALSTALLCGRGAGYAGVSGQADEATEPGDSFNSRRYNAEHVAQRRFEAERAAFLLAGARQAPPGKKDGGRELMTLTEWIGALARLAWQIFPHLGGIDCRLSALLEEVLLPAADAETLTITATNDAYDAADSVRVEAIFEHYRTDLRRIFASYAAADALSAEARGAQESINLGELTYFAKDGNLFDDRLTLTKLSSIFVKVNAGGDGGGGDEDEDEQELVYDEWLEVLARICCLKVGAEPGVGEPFELSLQVWLGLLFVPTYKRILMQKANGVLKRTI